MNRYFKEQVIGIYKEVVNPHGCVRWEDIFYKQQYTKKHLFELPNLVKRNQPNEWEVVYGSTSVKERVVLLTNSLYIKEDKEAQRIYLMGKVNIMLGKHPQMVIGILGHENPVDIYRQYTHHYLILSPLMTARRLKLHD